MNTKKSMKHLTVPKSDQLNSEQLIGSPITITITEAIEVNNPQQPLVIHYEGENGRPYKPCKTMMKVLKAAWTEFYEDWAGRSMTLYCDEKVRFGSEEVGGIRISHMSHIPEGMVLKLTYTRGKKAAVEVKRLEAPVARDYKKELRESKDMAATWKSFPANVRKELESFKEELKNKSAQPPVTDEDTFA